MGTNYYWIGLDGEEKHIGKSSAGWVFALHVYPDEGISDLPDWVRFWDSQEGHIKDEYDKRISVPDMLSRITQREWNKRWEDKVWYETNSAIPGPNNLARAKLDNRCVKHGSGTWDCHVGEFS